MELTLEGAVEQRMVLRIGEAEYEISFPTSSVFELERAIGRPMRNGAAWFQIQPKELPEVIKAGLLKHHPEEAAAVAEVFCGALNPESIETVTEAICAKTCPAMMARLRAEVEKLRGLAAKGLPLPKGLSAGDL